jgi:hypothetical protein
MVTGSISRQRHRIVRCLRRRSGSVASTSVVGAGRARRAEWLTRFEFGNLCVLHRQDLARVEEGPLIVFETLVSAVHLHLLRRFFLLQFGLQALDGLQVGVTILHKKAFNRKWQQIVLACTQNAHDRKYCVSCQRFALNQIRLPWWQCEGGSPFWTFQQFARWPS